MPTKPSWWRIMDETMACDSSNALEVCMRPALIRFSTAFVSRNASSGMTSGSSGPCTVTR